MNNVFQEWLDQSQTLSKLWMDTMSRMTGAAMAFSPGSTPPEAARQVRDAFLSSFDHSVNSYMRSEPFLRSMRQSLDLAMEMRKQFTQFMTQVQHTVGTAAEEDIRSLMLGVRHVEERITRRLEHVSARLEDIESRLDELQDSVAGVDGGYTEEENGDLPETKRMSRSIAAGRRNGRKPRRSGDQ